MTQKKTYRIAQVNRLLQEEIARLLLVEMKDPRLHEMTVTEVRTSKDLKHAQVFFTTHKTRDIQDSVEAANRCSAQLRKLINTRIRLKYIPQLEFRYDDSLDRAERIFKTLEQVEIAADEDDEQTLR